MPIWIHKSRIVVQRGSVQQGQELDIQSTLIVKVPNEDITI